MKKITLILFISHCLHSKAMAHSDHDHHKEPSIDMPLALDKKDLNKDAIQKINIGFKKKVLPLFKRACFDCHSNETTYPWYYSLPIAKQIIASDIQEAQSHLIFKNEFPFESHSTPLEDLLSIQKSIEDGTMPPFLYRMAHAKSELTKKEKNTILSWIKKAVRELK